MEEVFCRQCCLPVAIHSFVVANADLTYTIILNSRLSYEQLLDAYKHELCHIANGDYEKKGSSDLLEICAHGGV